MRRSERGKDQHNYVMAMVLLGFTTRMPLVLTRKGNSDDCNLQAVVTAQ